MKSSRVGLLYDSISSNTGDIAIGIALKQALSKRNIFAEIIDPFSYDKDEYDTVIVGGGQLLRDPGDSFYDLFRIKGNHILNSVGVSGKKAFSYLKDYAYLSARSTYEAEILESFVDHKVSVVPCTTTILESEKYTIPGLDLKSGEKVVGIHIIPDVLINCPDIITIINNIPHKKVFIPFTHYNQDASFMKYLPFDKSNSIMLDKLEPLELHSIISQMDYVIVSSLHASIFAYTQNVPFISMYQKKTHDYFKDRQLEKYVYETQDQLDSLIKEIELSPPDMRRIIRKDKKTVEKAINTYADVIKSRIANSKDFVEKDNYASRLRNLNLEIQQLKGVVEKRDLLIHNIIYQNIRSHEDVLKSLNLQLKKQASVIEELKNELLLEKTSKQSKVEKIAHKLIGIIKRKG